MFTLTNRPRTTLILALLAIGLWMSISTAFGTAAESGATSPSTGGTPAQTPTDAAPVTDDAPAPKTDKTECARPVSVRQFRKTVKPLYRQKTVTKKTRRTVKTLKRCARDGRVRIRMERELDRYRADRFERLHPWEAAYREFPTWLKQKLRSIRSCETRGIPYPQNYRYHGSSGYLGAYQFSASSWRAAGGRIPAYQAEPREQDVRAGRWYLSHGPSHWPVCGR